MSIWATFWSAAGDNHTDKCAVWVQRDGLLEKSNKPCSCGQPGAPIVYQGSHILPDEEDRRGGYVSLSLVPSHITRDGRDDRPEEGTPYPWVRVSLETEDVILDEQQAAAMYRALGDWLLARSTSAEPHRPSS